MINPIPEAWHFVRHRLSAVHPFEVQAQLLNACNLRCAYCKCPDVKTATLTAEQWIDAVRGLARAGTRRFKAQGGEPTLFKGLGDICAVAQSLGMKTAVTTNGFGIARDPSLLDHLDEIVVSLDALDPARHDRWRGAGSHQVGMTALALAADRGVKAYVNMIVHRDTWPDLLPMLEFCEQRGFRLNAQAVMFATDYHDEGAADLGLSQREESRLYSELAELARQGRSLMFAAATYERTARWPDYAARVRAMEGVSGCMAGRYYIHIEPNGDVHPCNYHLGSFTPKNMIRDGLEAALRHARRHNCADCGVPHLDERKLLFAFRPAAILQLARRG
jgi:MoaA/NifB/PqqE/SkfB family radical SAM enzyme